MSSCDLCGPKTSTLAFDGKPVESTPLVQTNEAAWFELQITEAFAPSSNSRIVSETAIENGGRGEGEGVGRSLEVGEASAGGLGVTGAMVKGEAVRGEAVRGGSGEGDGAASVAVGVGDGGRGTVRKRPG